MPGDDPSVATPRTDSSVVMGQFQLTDPIVRGTIQTSSHHSRCSSRSTVLLRRIDESNWQLKYRLEMVPEGESPLRMGLTFPSTFVDFDSVIVSRAEPAWHEVHDGMRKLDLLLNRNENSKSVIVQFETTLVEPKQPDWELPLPVPLYSTGHETVVVVEPDAIWYPTGGENFAWPICPSGHPAFIVNFPVPLSVQVAGPAVQIQRDAAQSERREPLIRLLDQRLWLQRGGRRAGITQAFLSSLRNDLEFDIPRGCSVNVHLS